MAGALYHACGSQEALESAHKLEAEMLAHCSMLVSKLEQWRPRSQGAQAATLQLQQAVGNLHG
jgi:hypothetical protein